MTKVKKNILSKLKKHLEPSFIEVIDESHLHANHNPDAKSGGTHFKVKIISNTFKGKSNIEKHGRWAQTIMHQKKIFSNSIQIVDLMVLLDFLKKRKTKIINHTAKEKLARA